jgi:hypothetical protein
MAFAPTAAKVGNLSEDLDEGLRLCYHTSPPGDRVLVHAGHARQAGPHVEQNPLPCFGPVVQPPLRKLNDPELRVDKVCKEIYPNKTYTVNSELSWSSSGSRLSSSLGFVHELDSYLLKAQADPAVTVRRGRRFLLPLSREQQPRTLREEYRQKEGLAITLARAIIANPHSHEEESSWCP